MMYNIELNIKNLDERLINNMMNIGENNGFDTHYHGRDRLVFSSEHGLNFTKLINELDNVCKVYGVDYISLLDLD